MGCLSPLDIVSIVNYAWAPSFADVAGNKKAICKRGWYLYNQNLLLDPRICNTISEEDKQEERQTGLVPTSTLSSTVESEHKYNENLLVRDNHQTDLTKIEANTSKGVAGSVLDRIVAAENIKESRDRIKKKKQESKLQGEKHEVVKEKLKAPTAGSEFLDGITCLGMSTYQKQLNLSIKAKQSVCEKWNNQLKKYNKMKCNYEQAIQTYNSQSVKKWSGQLMNAVLPTLRRPGNGPKPESIKKVLMFILRT